jgi:hypothetical protein
VGIEQAVIERLRAIPPEKHPEVVAFLESLARSSEAQDRVANPLRGLCSDLGIHISEEAIDAARRELWANFPRDTPE